jgi:hypothetical protein
MRNRFSKFGDGMRESGWMRAGITSNPIRKFCAQCGKPFNAKRRKAEAVTEVALTLAGSPRVALLLAGHKSRVLPGDIPDTGVSLAFFL